MALNLIYTRNCKVFVSGDYHVTQIYWYYDTTFIDGSNVYEGSINGIKVYYRSLSTGQLVLLNAGTYDTLIFNNDESDPFDITNGNFAPSLDNYYGYQFCYLDTLVKFSIATADAYPNFELNVFADSPFCTINVFDLTIEHISSTPDTGSTNGTFTVQVLNTYEPTLYSLDGTTWQTSNVFTGLSSDTYIVYVKDSLLNVKTQAAKIDSVNNYVTRWQCQFYDRLDQLWYVDIKEKDYALAALDITMGPSPVTISTGSSDGNKYEIIRGSECKIQLVSEADFQFSDLFTDDERQFQVVISRDVVTGSAAPVKTAYWTGYVLPDVYREPFTCTPYIIEVSASDGFGTLKDLDYKFLDGDYYSGMLDSWTVINEILNKLNLWLNVKVINYLCETSDSLSAAASAYSNNPFGFIYVNLNGYKDKNCDFILRSILQIWGCRIFQSGGYFWIERINDLAAETVDSFTDNYTQTNPAIVENENIIVELTNSADPDATIAVWQNQSQQLEILPAWKNSKVKNELIHNPQLIYNGDFEWWEDEDIVGFKKVYPTTVANINKIQISADNFGVEITGMSDSIVNANYIVSRKTKLKYSTLDKFKLSFRYNIDSPAGSGTINARLYLQLVYVPPPFTDENYCHYDTVDAVYEFDTTSDAFYIQINQISDLNDWKEFSYVTSLPANTEGFYFVRLFQIVQVLGIPGSRVYNSIQYDYVRLEIALNENDTKTEQTFEGNSFNNITFKPETIEVFHGDAPEATNSNVAYLNPLLLADGSNTTEWGDGQEPILRILTDDMQNEHRFRTLKLSGTLFTKILNYSSMVKDANVPYSLFMVNYLQQRIKTSEHEVELIELINYIDGNDPDPLYPDADIILTETGDLFVDEGNTGYITLETSLS